ncbi:MAG: hypothetical protein ABI910_03330 [Gemmatimonadota bacterium]
MNSRFLAMTLVAALVALPAVMEGQSSPPPVRSLAPIGRKTPEREEIPESHLPPRGMCRIWIDNVPAAQQPAPTDCASAIKNRPSNGRVIFPEDGGRGTKGDRENEKSAGTEAKDEKGRRTGKDTTAGEDGKSSRDRKDSKPRRP